MPLEAARKFCDHFTQTLGYRLESQVIEQVDESTARVKMVLPAQGIPVSKETGRPIYSLGNKRAVGEEGVAFAVRDLNSQEVRGGVEDAIRNAFWTATDSRKFYKNEKFTTMHTLNTVSGKLFVTALIKLEKNTGKT